MRILVTNDDGIDAPGLIALVRALDAVGHELEVAAPSSDRSGSGSGLGSIEHGIEIAYEERELPGLPDVKAISFDAPPAFAVLASCTGSFGPRPDLVVSGINDGFNTGRLLLTSSTVGAALTAGSLGTRALAISAGFAPGHRFDTASMVAVKTIDWMVEHSAPRTVLNVNVPNLDVEELKGVRVADLAPRGLMGLRLRKGDGVLTLERFENDQGLGVDTDAALVHAGYVAISVLPSVSSSIPNGHATNPAELVERALAGEARTAARH